MQYQLDRHDYQLIVARMPKLEVKHIEQSDINALVELQQNSHEQFCGPYPHHSDWLRRVSEEISQGNRPAYGVFIGNVILASVILKRIPYTTSLELKSLSADSRHTAVETASPVNLGQNLENAQYPVAKVFGLLVTKVETYASRRGFRELRAEVPAVWNTQIKFLIDHNFQLDHTREGRDSNHLFYTFRKKIAVPFVGDRLDFLAKCKWFLEEYFAESIESFTGFDPANPTRLQKLCPEQRKLRIKADPTNTSDPSVCHAIRFYVHPISASIQMSHE